MLYFQSANEKFVEVLIADEKLAQPDWCSSEKHGKLKIFDDPNLNVYLTEVFILLVY